MIKWMRSIALAVVLGASLPGCIRLTLDQERQLNEYAVGISHDNQDAALTDASVWCYFPGNDVGDGTNFPTVVAYKSVDLLKYGGCDGIRLHGTGATQCSQVGEGWFCVVAKEG